MPTREYEASRVMAGEWRKAQPFKPRKGWPKGGPTLPRRLADHISHYRTPKGLVYRAEPYGPFGSEEIRLLGKLLDEWKIEINPLGSTYFPGSTMQLLFRRKAS
jgi:hypothetical protein